MKHRDLAEIDRELEELGSVPAQLSRIVAGYGGWGLELDEVDETLEAMTNNAAVIDSLASSEIASVRTGEAASIPEVQFAPEAKVIESDSDEVFQDDVDENIAQEVFVEAESQGLIQQISEPPEVSVSYETPSDDEPKPVEYADVLPGELRTIDQDIADIKATADLGRHSFAEFVDEDEQKLSVSNDQFKAEESVEQPTAEPREFDAVYFQDSEEELPATDELRASMDPEFDEYDDESTFASEIPPAEGIKERNPFRDSEYKRLLDLELDPSDFPQSEPPSKPLRADDANGYEELESLDDDDVVEIDEVDIEIGDDTGRVAATEDEAEGQDENVEVIDDESRR